ncbi:hypothetical protein [uncultured Spirosoma sp.]|uniref:hypothetical protein n=1 Tax=uncultured Spirosoma sp. TaxID=278208 RepID=UPI00259034AD|nr:hypothetical protein [uncultured Spirosoma sp.]
MLVTICFIHQLPQALVLADSYCRNSLKAASDTPAVVIGLADDPAHLPQDVQFPYPILPVGTLFTDSERQQLSDQYTPVEFAAACKPRFLTAVFARYPTVQTLLYADPNVLFLHSIQPILDRLRSQTLLLTPYLLQAPGDTGPGKRAWPDEKHLQNIGLYNADFLAFSRAPETEQLLAWWQSRAETRAYIDFCKGLCTDQIWLMHAPVFFAGITILHDPSWHVALWNLPQRPLRQRDSTWELAASGQPVLFANMKGLFNPDEGFFPHQTRLNPAKRSDVMTLLRDYRQQVAAKEPAALTPIRPAYGMQPVPLIVRGWRRTATTLLTALNKRIDTIYLPALPR